MATTSQNLRRDSCPSSEIYPPCVNKAMVYLEKLKCLISKSKNFGTGTNVNNLESVLKLISRMESETLNNEMRISSERDKIFHYTCRIEKLSIIRLEQLPQFVQNEHLRASANLNELEWHLNYTESLVEKAKKRYAFMQKLNSKLLNEMQNIQDYKPLVDDKLTSESETLDQIAKDKIKTLQLLSDARQKLKDTEIKKEEAIRSAHKERARFKNELKRSNKVLNDLRKELHDGELFENETTEKITEVGEKLGILLLQQSELNKTLLVKQEKVDRVREVTDRLSTRLAELTDQHEELEGINATLNDALTKRRAQQNEKQNRLQDKLNKAEDGFRKAKRRNNETELDTEDMSVKIIKCRDQIHKSGIQMEYDMDQLENVKHEIKELLLELSEIKAQHETLALKMKTIQTKQMDQEAKQIHVKELLENQIRTDQLLKKSWNDRASSGSVQLEGERKEASRKRVTLRKTLNELQELLKLEREQNQEIRPKEESSNQLIMNMRLDLQKILEETADIELSFKSEEEALSEKYNASKTSISNLERRLEYLMWKQSTMNNKLEEINKYTGAIHRGMRPIQEEIKLLSYNLTELTIQNETNLRQEDQLKTKTVTVLERISNNQKKHQEFLVKRRTLLESLAEKVLTQKKNNEKFASNYRCLQNEYLELKKSFLDLIANRNQKEADIRDLKQILMLRAHLSHEEGNLLKLQELYHRSLFDQCEEESFKATDLLQALTKTIEKSIENVCIASNIH